MELKTLGCPYSQELKLGTIHHPHTDHRDNKAQGNLHLCVLANIIFTTWCLAQRSETTRFCKLLRGTATWGPVCPKSHWVSPLFLECRRRKGWKTTTVVCSEQNPEARFGHPCLHNKVCPINSPGLPVCHQGTLTECPYVISPQGRKRSEFLGSSGSPTQWFIQLTHTWFALWASGSS